MNVKKYAVAVMMLFVSVVPLFSASTDGSAVTLSQRYVVTSRGTSSVTLTALLPRTHVLRQDVFDIRYSIEPNRVFEKDGNKYAEFKLANVRGEVEISITSDMILHPYNLNAAMQWMMVPVATDVRDFLRHEAYIEPHNDEIRAIAQSVNGSDPVDTVQKIYQAVARRLSYRGYVPEEIGAAKVLERGYGDCSDFSDLMVSIARAKGIPARTVDGYYVKHGNDTPCHTWVEIYFEQYGWVPFDPLLTKLDKQKFDSLTPDYIYLSALRNDPTIGRFHYYTASYSGASVTVSASYAMNNDSSTMGMHRQVKGR